MATIELILRQYGVYIVICVITICIIYYMYKTCLEPPRPRPNRPIQTMEELRTNFNMRNRELIEYELSIRQEQLDITNTLKNYLEQMKRGEGIKEDDITIIVGPDGDLQLGTKIKNEFPEKIIINN